MQLFYLQRFQRSKNDSQPAFRITITSSREIKKSRKDAKIAKKLSTRENVIVFV
jgi:hypothetical protein